MPFLDAFVAPANPITPADLPPDAEARASGLEGMILVQTAAEATTAGAVQWCERAAGVPAAVAVVAMPIAGDGFDGTLDVLSESAAGARLRGVRFAADDGAADHALEAARRGLACLVSMESFRDLPAVIAVAGRCPDVRFVVEGLGAPPIATDELEPWRTRLRELAKCDNVVCVTNGVATPAASARLQHEARLWPYFDTAVQAFGPRRLMFGSGWPQLCGAWTYAGWFEAFEAWIEVLTEDDQARILGGTAREVFALG